MKLAFYYHIPICQNELGINVPGYLGVFIDALAENVEWLFLVMHSASNNKIKEADYLLKSKNITWINLGLKKSPLKRVLFPSQYLKNKLNQIEDCEAFIIRSPTPFAHSFDRFVKKPKIFFMVVGDYSEGANQIGKKGIKNVLLYYFFKFVDFRFRAKMKKTSVFVNSPQLFEKYKDNSLSIDLIKTTTLRNVDFFEKNDFDLNESVKLLYTGRIDPSKGLTELINACSKLKNTGLSIKLNIVGWEDNESKPFESELLQLAIKLGIENNIQFHGKKKIGEELNKMYRSNDIYVLASYHEGFPRTIWEAMANSLPVIATKVGAIPFYLKNEEDSILINPKKSDEIVDSVLKLIESRDLRIKLVKNGYKLASLNSLENQTKIMIQLIKLKL